ncbi:hypothetical protein MRX96_028777 [Rhipicephalus microplus]
MTFARVLGPFDKSKKAGATSNEAEAVICNLKTSRSTKAIELTRLFPSINGFITDAWNLVIKSAKRLSLDLSVGIIVSKCFKCFVRITCAACEDASLA